ncbi:MAG: CBS domain-containing protein [Deltaproteobacteria bacterium]|nr:CBS domain-containing protein [Deltaproteobacteria bacterium]
MDVITTHVNADFDCLASMVAAKKLYPEARPVFAGSQESTLRQFFLHAASYTLKFDRLKNINLDEIKRLIIVDTRSRKRIGKFADLVGKPNVEVHIYDHHPAAPGDIPADKSVIRERGSTTTIFMELFQERGMKITPLEATIFALGIYEDTGSFTFASTRKADLDAAAYLLERGADLNLVSDFMTRELTAEQVSLLNDLIHSATTYDIKGISIVIAVSSVEKYIGDLAVLVHKLRDMENINALFVLVRMADRVYLVARSRIPEVNAGEILTDFHGGGHPSAASGTIKDRTLQQIKEDLLQSLRRHISPVRSARDIMTTPLVTINAGNTLQDASDRMTRYNINALPVLEGGRFAGVVTREIVQKGIFHQLQHTPVRELMSSDFETASPTTSLFVIEKTMIEKNQRMMPVIDRDQVIGAITRTDLLKALHEDIRMSPGYPVDFGDEEAVFSRNLRKLMEERLPVSLIALLESIGKAADNLAFSAYVVGGFVRDLLLGIRNLDIDIVVKGDGITLAKSFAEKHRGRIRSHPRFGTAVVILPDGFRIDFATARTEYYEYPAALPTVEISSVKKDLYRRDFTINTLIIQLNGNAFGRLIDYFGGQRDLKDRSIRVLHNLSFVEDPTRAFRAIRFETRFHFTIGRDTSNLIESAVRMNLFQKLSGKRVLIELKYLFEEENPFPSVRRMESFHLLQFIHPRLKLPREMAALFVSIKKVLAWFNLLYLDIPIEPYLVYLLGLLHRLDEKDVKEAGANLELPQDLSAKYLIGRDLFYDVLNRLEHDRRIPPSEIDRLLTGIPMETLLLMMALTDSEIARKRFSNYLTRDRSVKPEITGDEIGRLGFAPGPVYRRILERLRYARLDGEVKTKEEELQLIRKEFSERKNHTGRNS